MDRQRTNDTLGSTDAIPQHPGAVDAKSTKGEEQEPQNAEAEQGRMAQRGAAAAVDMSQAEDEDPSTDDEAPGQAWRGQEVADAPDGVAERGAARAANFMPKRRGDEEYQPSKAPPTPPMSDEEVRATQELKRQSAVEEHEVQKAEGTGTAPKKL